MGDSDAVAVKAAGDLRDDGFAVVERLFTPDELAEVELLLDALFGGFDRMSHGGRGRERLFARDMAIKSMSAESGEFVEVDQPEILYAASLDPRLQDTAVFRKVQALARSMKGGAGYCFDHAIFKAPRNQSQTDWHQDIALTRVSHLPEWMLPRRFHCWIPLQPVSQENGCMEFIAGSHRGPVLDHRPVERRTGEMGWMATPQDGAHVACPLELGSMTIHDPRTLHFTGRNQTDKPRKAWIVHFSQLGNVELALKRSLGRVPRAAWTA